MDSQWKVAQKRRWNIDDHLIQTAHKGLRYIRSGEISGVKTEREKVDIFNTNFFLLPCRVVEGQSWKKKNPNRKQPTHMVVVGQVDAGLQCLHLLASNKYWSTQLVRDSWLAMRHDYHAVHQSSELAISRLPKLWL